jgi:hypothetical protein
MNKTRRHLLGAGLAVPMLGGCIFSHDVFIEWEEEILLPDGKTMTVHVKHSWQRMTRGFTPKEGRFIARDCWLTFDADGTNGKITQLFKGWRPLLIGHREGVWYVWLHGGGPYYQSDLQPDQKWQLDPQQNGAFAALQSGKFVAIAQSTFPKEFLLTNFFRVTSEPKIFFVLDKQKLTLEKKKEWPDKFHTYAYPIYNYR